ncbi:MAG: nitrile hydratase subunit beta [Mycobacterium sp.]
MNGIFDFGGTDGMGPVDNDHGTEPVFRADWEKAAFSMFAQGARAGLYNIDQFRHCVEQMDPAEYLLSNYYEHWTHALETFAEQHNVFDHEELEERIRYYRDNPDAPLPAGEDPEILDFVNTAITTGFSAARDIDKAPTLKVGDRVRIAADSPTGHTRRARYIRGKVGVITAAHGAYVYPDTAGNGLGECPEHVYTVKFTATELWGEDIGDANGAVYFDVWEPYCTPESAPATQGA